MSAVAKLSALVCGLFLAALLLIELHFTVADRAAPSREEVTVSGSVPVALYGGGVRGHCFVDGVYRGVPQGSLKVHGIGRFRMVRLPADGVPKRVVCSGHVRLVESRFVPLYRLIDTDRAVVAAAVALMGTTCLGWLLPLGRRLVVSRG